MTNNLEIIKPLLEFPHKDIFYFIQVLQRKKDHEGKSKKSSKKWKKLRNKWLRRTKLEEIPDTKIRKGYEF